MVFTNGEQRIFYRTMLGVGLMVMQQLTGINLITYVHVIAAPQKNIH